MQRKGVVHPSVLMLHKRERGHIALILNCMLFVLVILFLYSCQQLNSFQKNSRNSTFYKLSSRNTITLSVEESDYVEDYYWLKSGEIADSFYTWTDVKNFAKAIKVEGIYRKRIVAAFQKVFPSKNVEIVDKNGMFILKNEYFIGRDGKLYLGIKLYDNLSAINMMPYLNKISDKFIDCKVSVKYKLDHKRTIKFFEAFNKEWKPEKHTEEIGIWLENALQKYLYK